MDNARPTFAALPTYPISRNGHGLDYSHVCERIFQRHRHFALSLDGSGKIIALQTILVANRQFLHTSVAAAGFDPSSMKMRQGLSGGALNGTSISTRPLVPRICIR